MLIWKSIGYYITLTITEYRSVITESRSVITESRSVHYEGSGSTEAGGGLW